MTRLFKGKKSEATVGVQRCLRQLFYMSMKYGKQVHDKQF
jgi:hypothetical protein